MKSIFLSVLSLMLLVGCSPTPEQVAARQKAEEDRAATLAKKEADKEEEKSPQTKGKTPPTEKGVSRDNYNRIKDGMTMKKVEAILGPGKEVSSSGGVTTYSWQDNEFNTISILFQKGKVKSKSILSDK